MSYADKYAQHSGRAKGTHGHWEGTPSGSSYNGTGCWCCARGCAVLCVTAIKGEDPSKENITKYLNSSADVVWSKAGLSSVTSPSSFPAIGKLSSRSHYVILTGASGANYNVWDPDGGSAKTMAKSSISTIYK